MTADAAYDRMGVGYRAVRRPDPRIAAAIVEALGDARTVVNVGAGAGSYEPADREVVAVEPSERMVAQRAPGAAPVVRARAEALPFGDGAFDAALAVLTVHHWDDVAAGLAELVRVARRRIVVVTMDSHVFAGVWLVRDYFPEALEVHARLMPAIPDLLARLPNAEVRALPVPAGCEDGFFAALWDRPELHLDPDVRRASSVWHQLPPDAAERGLHALEADLASGRWRERHGHLLGLPELDVGLRLVMARLDGGG